MERFRKIYPFTTENIAGYMSNLDLKDKKILTVTGSGDHVLNAISQGCLDITTFDLNSDTQFYLNLKIAAIKELEYSDFLQFLLYPNNEILSYRVFEHLDLDDESKIFFDRLYFDNLRDGILLREKLFYQQNYNPDSKLIWNIYLDKNKYYELKEKISSASIKFFCSNLVDLKMEDSFSYLFLSNISDYLKLMFNDNDLENFKKLLDCLNVDNIYFAYIYDVFKKVYRSRIDDLEEVSFIFKNYDKLCFSTALEGVGKEVKDAVLILRKR